MRSSSESGQSPVGLAPPERVGEVCRLGVPREGAAAPGTGSCAMIGGLPSLVARSLCVLTSAPDPLYSHNTKMEGVFCEPDWAGQTPFMLDSPNPAVDLQNV